MNQVTRWMRWGVVLAGLLATGIMTLAGCGGGDEAALQARREYENPGGMWMPGQLAAQKDVLRELGVERPDRLAELTGDELGAIVWLGGCSGSFVSENGLILTNHHCATGSLAYYSEPNSNVYEHGHVSRSRAEELGGEPGKKVWVTRRITDVTEQVRAGLADIEDPLERYKTLEQRVKDLVAQCEAGQDDIRCEAQRFYERANYYLIEMLELRDVRLVYAPPRGIGFYGGEVDNWHWPRHTGDFAFYRAYVGPDGEPAAYAPQNVPYNPAEHLRVAREGLKPHDLVIVAGYPGRTQRWQTAAKVIFDYEQQHPRQIELSKGLVEVYRELASRNDELAIKTQPRLFGLVNRLQFLELVQEAIERAGLIDEKKRQEAELLAWIQSDPDRARQWGGVLEDIEAVNEQFRTHWWREELLNGAINRVELLDAAHTIVRMAQERPKPDSERDPGFQERNWDALAQSMRRMERTYDAVVDKAVMKFYLRRLCGMSAEAEPVVRAFDPALVNDCQGVDEWVENLWREPTAMEDAQQRVELLETASLAYLEASGDPWLRLALRLRPFTKDAQEQGQRQAGIMAMLRPEYVQARQAFHDEPLASDANGTLRMTFGTVRGYESPVTGETYEPFTTLDGVVAKHTGEEPFDAPGALLQAADEVDQDSTWYVEELDGLPVNFLSDCDITGGNSGSATINGRGELVGVVFDGNSESLASDWVYMPEITRAIHVDIRYVEWVLEEVSQAQALLNELGLARPGPLR